MLALQQQGVAAPDTKHGSTKHAPAPRTRAPCVAGRPPSHPGAQARRPRPPAARCCPPCTTCCPTRGPEGAVAARTERQRHGQRMGICHPRSVPDALAQLCCEQLSGTDDTAHRGIPSHTPASALLLPAAVLICVPGDRGPHLEAGVGRARRHAGVGDGVDLAGAGQALAAHHGPPGRAAVLRRRAEQGPSSITVQPAPTPWHSVITRANMCPGSCCDGGCSPQGYAARQVRPAQPSSSNTCAHLLARDVVDHGVAGRGAQVRVARLLLAAVRHAAAAHRAPWAPVVAALADLQGQAGVGAGAGAGGAQRR